MKLKNKFIKRKTEQKINKTQRSFFENTNEIYKFTARQKKRRVITCDPIDIKRINWNSMNFLQRSDNLHDMEQFLERHKVPKVTQREVIFIK